MKIIFIRHSEPDYGMLDKAKNPEAYTGFGRDLAPLTARGRALAEEVAHNSLLDEAELVISSSVTRALETASYLVRHRNLPLLVEPFFHEWRPDLSQLNYTEHELGIAYQAFWDNGGALSESCPIRYETAEEMRTRFLEALEKYRHYQAVAIVCHGMLMRQFVDQDHIDYCDIIEVTL